MLGSGPMETPQDVIPVRHSDLVPGLGAFSSAALDLTASSSWYSKASVLIVFNKIILRLNHTMLPSCKTTNTVLL